METMLRQNYHHHLFVCLGHTCPQGNTVPDTPHLEEGKWFVAMALEVWLRSREQHSGRTGRLRAVPVLEVRKQREMGGVRGVLPVHVMPPGMASSEQLPPPAAHFTLAPCPPSQALCRGGNSVGTWGAEPASPRSQVEGRAQRGGS